MKVAYLLSRAMQAGPSNQSLNILAGLKRLGVDVTLLTFDPEIEGDSWINRFVDEGIRIHQFNLKSKNPIRAAWLLRSYVKSNRIDIIHGCGTRVDLIEFLSGHQAKRVVTHRSYPDMIAEGAPNFIRNLVVPVYMHVLRKMDSVVACSEAMQNAFHVQCNMNMECVQNAVNTDFFHPLEKSDKEILRTRLNVKDIPTFLVLGSLLPRKNNSVIIDAINAIPDFKGQVLFVGAGPEETKLKLQANNNPHIDFRGSTLSPIDYLQASDFLISASTSEGLPNSVLEAISCGLIPILSNIDPHKEIVKGSSIDYSFCANDSKGLSLLLQDLILLNTDEKSKEARRLALENYAVGVMAKKYLEIYKGLLNN